MSRYCMGLSAVDARRIEDALSADDGLADVDLDEYWMDLHAALTGGMDTNGDPLFDAVLGGCPVGAGPLFLGPEQVRAVTQALLTMTEADLRAGHTAAGAEDFERVCDYFVELVDFYRESAEAGWGVLKYLY